MSEHLIRLNNVRKVFSTEEVETHALSCINLEIRKGEYVAITGPSGCGKSTLLSLLGLLDAPTQGKYELSGKDVSNISRKESARIRNREIGFIFQSFNLISDMSVAENVELPLTYNTDYSSAQRKRLTTNALEVVGMTNRANHFPAQLSGGQQQRVAVARAIVGSPSILLADEPTGNLDTTNAKSVMQLLENLHADGSTICMVTHDPGSALRAERRIDMLDGKIVSDASTTEHANERFTQELEI